MRFLSIIFCFISLFGYTQEPNYDSLWKARKYQKVIDLLNAKRDTAEISFKQYYILARSYGRNQQYNNGFVTSLELLTKAIEAKDTTAIVDGVNVGAENLIDMNRYEHGIKFSEKGLKYFRPKDSVGLQSLRFKTGMMHYHLGNYQKAYEHYKQITRKQYTDLPIYLHNYALALTGVGKFEEAKTYFNKSIKAEKNKPVMAYMNIALVLMDQSKWETSKTYLDSAANNFNKNTQIREKRAVYNAYFDLFEHQNKLSQAKEVLHKIKQLNEDELDKNINEQVNAVQLSNDKQTVLRKKVKIIDNELETSEKQKLLVAVFSLLTIIGLISFIYYYKYQKIKSENETILTEQKLLRSQMTPHFIFNSLSVLQGMILNNEDKKAVKYLSKFSKLLRLILESSREKFVSLDEELAALKNYVDLQNMQAKTPFKYAVEIDESLEYKDIYLPPMLIQPFVENTIEHGFKDSIKNPEILLKLDFKGNTLNCEIIDNGVGIGIKNVNTNSNKKSLATKITSERLQILAKQFNVDTNLNVENREKYNQQGTRVTLTLPFKTTNNA